MYSFWGAAVAEGFFHGFSGWLIFIFTLGVLVGEMWVLRKIGRAAEGIPGTLFSPQFVVAVVIMAVTLGISLGVEFREKIPIKQALSRFPTQIGEWTGTSEPMERQFIKALQFSDYVIMNYQDRQGRSVNFYTAYYESQRKGESIHSPETCLPGGGWEFREAGAVTIPVAVDGKNGTDTQLGKKRDRYPFSFGK